MFSFFFRLGLLMRCSVAGVVFLFRDDGHLSLAYSLGLRQK